MELEAETKAWGGEEAAGDPRDLLVMGAESTALLNLHVKP